MRFLSFNHAGRDSWGAIAADGRIADLGTTDTPDLLTALRRGLPASVGAGTLALDAVTLLPPVTAPGKIFCVGHNYEEHRLETQRAPTGHPSIFLRFADTLVAHGAAIVRPEVSTMLDYEGELAVIIGKGGRNIAEADALAHVAGYACANDASIRDWQHHTRQFTPGKNFPATGGFGPWLVTPDEVPGLPDAVLTTRLNGQVMQRATIAQQIFPIPTVIAYLSAFTALGPGDVILTGTPGGVGAKREPPVWMRPGDIVEVEIDGVGLLSNPVAAETV